jgi:hypothetical protein
MRATGSAFKKHTKVCQVGQELEVTAVLVGSAEKKRRRTSVEPSGLQVSGVLRSQDWSSWHEALSTRLSQFPVFEV